MTRSASMAVLGAIIVIAGGYLLQLGIGRAVVPSEFEFLQETLAFYMMSMLPLQPITAVVTKQSARHNDGLWADLTRAWLIVALIAATLACFFATRHVALPHWDVPTLIMFGLSVVSGIAFLITNALVVGRLDFFGSSVVQAAQASLRVGLGLPLVWSGTGARGLWCATAIANATAALCAKCRLSLTRVDRAVHVRLPSRLKRDLAIAVACYAGIAVLTQIDLIYARRFYPMVPIYAGASVFGKLVFYVPTAASSVALPMLARSDASPAGQQVLKRAAILASILAAVCIAGMGLLGQSIAVFLLGNPYARSGAYITVSAIAVLPYSLVSLFASATLAAGRFHMAIACVTAAAVVGIVSGTGKLSLVGFDGLLALVGMALAWIGWRER